VAADLVPEMHPGEWTEVRGGDRLDPRRILVVAGSADERHDLTRALASAGHDAAAAASLADGLRGDCASIGLVVLAQSALDPTDPVRAFDELRRRDVVAPCLVTLGDATVDAAVSLMRLGAFSVVSLPIDPEKLAFQVEQALRHRDLCEKNASLERSLETHERLAMIGKLAAGVAHELNNPLDGVLRFVNLAVDGLPKDSQQIPYLLEARRGLRRMADIVRDLLQFSRNANVDASHEDAERLAKDAVLQVVAGVQHRRVETKFDFPPVGVPLPRGMFQVFGNLAKNAVDAMPQGGTLSVSARLANGRVRIDVSDTGTGIPEEIRDRIFEPFFTTKEVGKGTGLGLPICQRIVERLGGTLTIETEVGRGTSVAVDLPARRSASAGRASMDAPLAVARADKETK
jgi:signal transduction histidine kinase